MPKNFGSLKKDGNNQTIQAAIGFQTYDASTSPKTSPLSYSSSVITIAVPSNAIEVSFLPSTSMRVSELSNMASYFTVDAGREQPFELGSQDYIYIKRDSEDGVVNFRFILI